MVTAAETTPTDPARALAIGYAPAGRRGALAALLALDDVLAGVVRGARDPMVGQLRLTWWHDALTALDITPPPAQPVLRAVAEDVLPAGVEGAAMAEMVDGWEQLLDREPMTPDRLSAYAAGRGATLFALAGRTLGAAPGDPLARAGEGWALADLAARASDATERDAATAMARNRFLTLAGSRWSRSARPLGALAMFARQELPGAGGSPVRRLTCLLRLRLTGRWT